MRRGLVGALLIVMVCWCIGLSEMFAIRGGYPSYHYSPSPVNLWSDMTWEWAGRGVQIEYEYIQLEDWSIGIFESDVASNDQRFPVDPHATIRLLFRNEASSDLISGAFILHAWNRFGERISSSWCAVDRAIPGIEWGSTQELVFHLPLSGLGIDLREEFEDGTLTLDLSMKRVILGSGETVVFGAEEPSYSDDEGLTVSIIRDEINALVFPDGLWTFEAPAESFVAPVVLEESVVHAIPSAPGAADPTYESDAHIRLALGIENTTDQRIVGLRYRVFLLGADQEVKWTSNLLDHKGEILGNGTATLEYVTTLQAAEEVQEDLSRGTMVCLVKVEQLAYADPGENPTNLPFVAGMVRVAATETGTEEIQGSSD